MECSPTIGAIAGAMARARGLMGSARKNARNGSLSNRYADLSAVIDATIPAAAECELAVLTHPGAVVAGRTWTATTKRGDAFEAQDFTVEVGLTIAHSSGEWMRWSVSVPFATDNPGVNRAQALGSAISYGRRYLLMGAFSIAADDDDDGVGSGAGMEARRLAAEAEEAERRREQEARAAEAERRARAAADARAAETPEQREARQRSHHPSWAAARAAVAAELREAGTTIDAVSARMEAAGLPRLSALDPDQRRRAIAKAIAPPKAR